MTTQTDRALLARIERFDKTPRKVVVADPAQLITYEEGQWKLGLINIGEPISISAHSFPVMAGPIEIERILPMIPAPSDDIFMQQWVVTIGLSQGETMDFDVSATGSRLAILKAGIEFAQLQSENRVPVSVEVIEKR